MVFKLLKSSYEKIKGALEKTRSSLNQTLFSLFQNSIDSDTIEKIEEALYEADLGAEVALSLTEKLKEHIKTEEKKTPQELITFLKNELKKDLKDNDTALDIEQSPSVILMVGVNGNGKTTSIAKLANQLQKSGKSVLVAACDTFRAAASDQIAVWCERLNVPLVKSNPGADPAAVAFDAVTRAVHQNIDVVLIDTAGRLHTKKDLMQELEKIKRSCKKVVPTAPHETLLALDATTGQNGIDQAKTFHQFTPMTGLILNKLDGSAKGGIVIPIKKAVNIPIKMIGTGEGIEDLQLFDQEQFIDALFEV